MPVLCRPRSSGNSMKYRVFAGDSDPILNARLVLSCKRFTWSTFSLLLPRSQGNPSGKSAERSGKGPGRPLYRDLVCVSHGGQANVVSYIPSSSSPSNTAHAVLSNRSPPCSRSHSVTITVSGKSLHKHFTSDLNEDLRSAPA